MSTLVKRVLAASIAVLAAAAFAGHASAGRLSMSETSFKSIVSAGEFEDGSRASRVTCPVTLSGSFRARTFAKVRGANIGSLTGMSVGEAACTGEGEVAVEGRELPVAVEYQSFTGTLPNITEVIAQSLTIPNQIVRLRNPARFCVYSLQPLLGDFNFLMWRPEPRGTIVILRALMSLSSGSVGCPQRWAFRWESVIRNPAESSVTIRLI